MCSRLLLTLQMSPLLNEHISLKISDEMAVMPSAVTACVDIVLSGTAVVENLPWLQVA